MLSRVDPSSRSASRCDRKSLPLLPCLKFHRRLRLAYRLRAPFVVARHAGESRTSLSMGTNGGSLPLSSERLLIAHPHSARRAPYAALFKERAKSSISDRYQ